MSFYSYKKTYPETLPVSWKTEDGTTINDLESLADSQLEEIGFYGPIVMPDDISGTSSFTHRYTWNPDTLTFDATELSYDQKRERVNYQVFWDSLLDKSAYDTIKSASKSSLEVNTIVTEFISLISDAKMGNDNVEKIQQSMLSILSTVSFSPEEISEIQECVNFSGMFSIYTI